jgi:hypothetical protein
MFNFKLWLLPLIALLSLLSACGSDSAPEPDPHSVVEVQLNTNITTFPVGITQTVDAVAIFYNGDATNASAGASTWHSNNELIAIVNELGEVTGVGPGTTSIVATYLGHEPEVDGDIEITITEAVVTSIEIFPGDKELALGLTEEYEAKATFSDETSHYLDKNADLTWTSSNTIAVEIDITTAKAITKSEGDTIITASYQNTIEDTVTLHVSEKALYELIIEPVRQTGQTPDEESTVTDGYAINFTALASYSYGPNEDVTEVVLWSSSAEEFLTVDDKKGEFNGVGQGSSDVSATLNSEASNAVTVTVNHGDLKSIVIETEQDQIPVDAQYKFNAIASFTGGDTENISSKESVHWYSDNDTIASVTKDGLVEGVGEGITIIHVYEEGSDKSAQHGVVITEATLTSEIEITTLKNDHLATLGNGYLATGESMKFIAKGTYTDGTVHNIPNKSISWSLNNDSPSHPPYNGDASIDLNGMVLNNSSNTRETTDVVFVTAYIHDVEGWQVDDGDYSSDLVGLAATKILKIKPETGPSLSFVGPLTKGDADRIGVPSDGSFAFEEAGATGPDGASFMTATHDLAQDQCEALVYNKFNDYRLPTYDELQSVWTTFDGVSDDTYDLYTNEKWSVGQYFWTSSEHESESFKLVDLKAGITGLSDTATGLNYVSCVRENILP